MTAVAKLPTVDELAQEIRRVDGNHSLGAGALAEALMPFLAALSPAELGGVEKRAPVQGYHARNIPWEVHGLAWEAYARKYGRGQSAEQLANRGGFGIREMDEYLPDWRKRVAEIDNPTPRAAEAEWLPIESAPRDGTLVLLGSTDPNWPSRCRRWIDNHWRGWDADEATHWRPLPVPPSAKGE